MPLASISSLLLTGVFQSTVTKRCSGKRRSLPASGEVTAPPGPGPMPVVQAQKFSWSNVIPILCFGVACHVTRAW